MAVYVDDMRAQYGWMVMCHMVADTDAELHAMAVHIGVAKRWHQKAGTPHSHYDVCLAKRSLAVKAGAIEIGRQQLANIIRSKRLARSGPGGPGNADCSAACPHGRRPPETKNERSE